MLPVSVPRQADVSGTSSPTCKSSVDRLELGCYRLELGCYSDAGIIVIVHATYAIFQGYRCDQ